MAQHDYDIANQSGSAFRADLNNALQAIVSNNSGAAAPSTTYAHQVWVDTSTSPATIKRRDAANAAWITVGTIDANIQTFATAGAERLRIDSSGRVGIGTASPTELLQLSADTDPKIYFVDVGNTTAKIGIVGSTALGFEIAGSERLRIDSSGDVLVGTTTVRARLTLEKAFAGGTAIDTNTTTASTTYSAAVFRHNGTLVGQITASTTATAYVTSSDYRLKENIEPVADGITRLKQLNPSRFNFIADPDTTVDGFIAHEVQAVVPEAITGEKDAEDDDGNPIYQGIDQSKLVPLLTAALQEAIAKIETLEAKVAALESA